METKKIGRVKGGKKAAATIRAREPNFYRKIGSLGGKANRTGGFYKNPERAKELGKVGGKVSGYKWSEEAKARLKARREKS